MSNERRTLPIHLALAVFLAFPLTAAAEVCPVEIDTPALVTVEAASEITLDATTAKNVVVLAGSSTHLVIAAGRPSVLLLDGPAGCELRLDITRVEIRERMIFGPGDRAPAFTTSFHPLDLGTKHEDHDSMAGRPFGATYPDTGVLARPLLTLIHLDGGVPTKHEDHEIDPDPGFGLPSKHEDHEIDPDPGLAFPCKQNDHDSVVGHPFGTTFPDPGFGGCVRAWSWKAAAALMGRLGPGWYFIVTGGKVTQEILIDLRSSGQR